MHPIEHLRFVARGEVVSQRVLLREAAEALGSFAGDPAGMVLACRRLVALQRGWAALVWLAARTLTAPDAADQLGVLRAELEGDATPVHLSEQIPEGARVALLDDVEVVPAALASRGDVTLLVVRSGERAVGLRRRAGSAAVEPVPAHGSGDAVATADLVVIEARGIGPGEVLAPSGSRAFATAACTAGVPVVVVGGVGTVLPAAMWEPFVKLAVEEAPQSRRVPPELLPWSLVDVFVGPDGAGAPESPGVRTSCPIAPELFGGIVV